MEEEYRQGLNLVVEMLRSLEKLPDFRADTFTLQRIARLADTAKNMISVEEPSTLEAPPMEENVPEEVLMLNHVQAKTVEPDAPTPSFEELRTTVLACTKCPNLVAFRHTVVFGVGNPSAELMFVGEAPGADEDRQGEPFVGRAGELLTKIIQTMGFQRSEVYIA
ncbi:MAG TPA: uracil-DNA glycosylase, partial [Chthoniobacterales bacterium]|nr:uracil-DNA glycosylase [Chthoniobacterales bacterium]